MIAAVLLLCSILERFDSKKVLADLLFATVVQAHTINLLNDRFTSATLSTKQPHNASPCSQTLPIHEKSQSLPRNHHSLSATRAHGFQALSSTPPSTRTFILNFPPFSVLASTASATFVALCTATYTHRRNSTNSSIRTRSQSRSFSLRKPRRKVTLRWCRSARRTVCLRN